MPKYVHPGVSGVLSATNTQNQQVLETQAMKEINIVFEVFTSDGVTPSVFASENATIDVSVDSVTWIPVDAAVGLGTGARAIKYYAESSKATTLAVNPASWPYIRVTVPQIATKRTKIWATGK